MTAPVTREGGLRPDLYVILRVLETLARNSNPSTRSALQRGAGINYTLLVRYLELLRSRNLVTLDNSTGEVELTAKGYEACLFLRRGFLEVLGGTPDTHRGS